MQGDLSKDKVQYNLDKMQLDRNMTQNDVCRSLGKDVMQNDPGRDIWEMYALI